MGGCCAPCHYAAGDEVFFGGRPGAVNGLPTFGDRGLVKKTTCRGAVVDFGEKGLFHLNSRDILLRPPLRDYSVGTKLYYVGPKREYENGDVLNFGDVGEIRDTCGSSTTAADRLVIKFSGHRSIKRIRRALLFSEPFIPGGYTLGERVYWCGTTWAFADGDRLEFGQEGEIAGCTSVCDGMDNERVAVLFKGQNPRAMRLVEISRVVPSIPGGLRIGDRVYYAWPNWTAPDGSTLIFGTEGKVAGCSCIGDGSDDERIWVKFGDAFGCIQLNQITTEPPTIPGGFVLGEKVFYCGPSRSCNEGLRRSFGEIVEVTGRAASGEGIAVLFFSNQDSTDVQVTEVCREKPSIPCNFHNGEQVFYSGPCCSFPGGDLLVYGALGEVVGRSCLGDGEDEQRLAAVFQDNIHISVVYINQVSREVPADLHALLKQQLARADAKMHQPSPRRAISSASREQRSECAVSPSASTKDVRIDLKESPLHLLPQSFRTSGLTATCGAILEDMAPFAEIASVHRTAKDAGLKSIVEDANNVAVVQVKLARDSQDLTLLSEIAREAEECGWTDLHVTAFSELEQASLSGLLQHCAQNDVLAHRAIHQTAVSRGMLALAERAQMLLQSAFQKTLLDEDGLKDEMQMLLDETYTAWGGYGRTTRTRDRANKPMAERLEVDHIVPLSNMKIYLKYLIRQQVIKNEMPESAQTDWNVRTNSTSPISSDHGLKRRYPRAPAELRRDLNECYLWHGTGPNQAESISRKGFDLRQAGSGRGSLFGRGLYFAESCLKADEYAKENDNELFALILCRVTLGNVNYCDAEDPMAIRESLRRSCRASTDFYHSVLGDREKIRKTFREFVVFDENQAFPEYIVWYRRK